MIVNCEKCGTQYNIDDTKVKPGETKVRCTQCQHVFTIPHPLTLNETDIFGETEEKAEDAFMKEWAQDVSPQPPQEPRQAVPPATDQAAPPRAFVPPTTEEPLTGPEAPTEEMPPAETSSSEQEIFPASPSLVREAPLKKERRVSTTFLLAIILIGIVFVSFYYWRNRDVSFPAFEYIYEKIYAFMAGDKAQKIFIVTMRGSEYTLEGGTVFVIQGKVANRSEATKQSVKLQGILFDKVGKEVATSTSYCGVTITDGEIKNSTYDALKTSFGFIGVGQARPVPSQQNLPFTIIFFSPPEGASDFRVDIVETIASG
jgi:predicted Zn finger-like uncharacterized protein